MSAQITISGQGATIGIVIIGYEREQAENESDANWLSCSVDLRVGAFSAQYAANFATNDFREFRKQLLAHLEQQIAVAKFECDELPLVLSVALSRAGIGRVSGRATSTGQPSAALDFSFETDQSFLRSTLQQLDAALAAYPVR